jgi:hypothetical protein
MSQRRNETRSPEGSQGHYLGLVDDDRVLGIAVADEGDHAFAAS